VRGKDERARAHNAQIRCACIHSRVVVFKTSCGGWSDSPSPRINLTTREKQSGQKKAADRDARVTRCDPKQMQSRELPGTPVGEHQPY
jgi:hypothetical protein